MNTQPVRLGLAIVCAHLLAGCGGGTEPATPAAQSAPAAAAAPAAPAIPAGDWPGYNRTLAGDRFSPLDEIDRGNVAQLAVVCTYTLPEANSMQAGPIVIDGTMYFTTDRNSYSIDAATCAEKWRVERVSSRPSPLGAQRGFAYLDGRLFRGTSDAHVLALDAADGHTLWDVRMDVADIPGVSMPMAPIAANGLVYIGNAGGDQTGVTGHVYALDAQDGHIVWRFNVVPDEPAVRATWPNADRFPITGGAFWTSFALDAERNVLYVPAGNPAPDFDVEARGGDNLYSNSLIALDAATGQIVGYNQLVKRDEHDWDVNAPPVVATTRSGRPIVASANKDGLLSVVDRTQLAAGSPPAAGDLGTRLPTIFQSPTTTRLNPTVPLSRTERVRFCPGIQGGNEWNGAAFHPTLNTLYTGAVDWCASVQLAEVPAVPSPGAIWFGSAIGEIQEPAAGAKGWITAFDADTGAERWKFAAPAPVVAGVTPTAGGLVFTADLTGHLRAFDADTGAVLFELETGQSIGGGIVSYAVGGRQRIGVASGMKSGIWPGAATESRIQVFGLPAATPVVRLQNLAHAVASLDKTLPFYRDALGFTVNGDPLARQPQALNELMSKFTGTSGMSFRAATFKIPNAEFGFELTEFTGAARDAGVPKVQDIGAAMLVLRVRDVNAMLAKALAAGATVASTGGAPVGTAVVLRDPDGFLVELQQPATLPADATGDILGASINLSVADADKSVEFLRNAIGFEARPASAVGSNPTVLKLIGLEQAEWRIAHGHIPGTTADFGLIEYLGLPRAAFSPGAKDPGAPAFTMVVGDIASATAQWVKSGGTVSSTGGKPIVQPNGAGNVFVKDVDGFTWELIQRARQ